MPFEKPFRENEEHWLLYASSHLIVRGIGKVALGYKTAASEFVPETGRALIAFNHRHALDILLGPSAIEKRSIRMVAKKELFDDSGKLIDKLVSGLIKKWGAIAIDRQTPGPSTTREVLDILRAEGLVGVMPEGHRYQLDDLGPLQPGVAMWARLGEAPTIPAYIRGVDSIKSAVLHRSAQVIFGPPIDFPKNKRGEADYLSSLRRSLQIVSQLPIGRKNDYITSTGSETKKPPEEPSTDAASNT
jgi:1-acyl-sn-glycerol-3-phosphate acyltransferase